MKKVFLFLVVTGLALAVAGCNTAQQPAPSPPKTEKPKLAGWPAYCDATLSSEDVCYLNVNLLPTHDTGQEHDAIRLKQGRQQSIMFFSDVPNEKFTVYVTNLPGKGNGPGFYRPFRPASSSNDAKEGDDVVRISTGPPRKGAVGNWYKIKVKFEPGSGKADKDPHIIIDPGT